MATKSPDSQPIARDEAWVLLRRWIASDEAVSLIYSRANGQALAVLRGRLRETSPQLIELRGESALFTMNLQEASFEYGPVSLLARIDVGFRDSRAGLHVWTPDHDWLFLTTATASLPGDGALLGSAD